MLAVGCFTVPRPLAWTLTAIPLILAGALTAVRETNDGYGPARAAGAVVAVVLVAVLIVGLIRVAWIRRGDRAGKLVQPSVLLAAGLVSIIFFLALAANENRQAQSTLRTQISAAASCAKHDPGPFASPPTGFAYVPLTGALSQRLPQINAEIVTGTGSANLSMQGMSLTHNGKFDAAVLVVAGGGTPKNRGDIERGVLASAQRSGLPVRTVDLGAGRRVLLLAASGGVEGVTSSRCYEAIVLSPSATVVEGMASILAAR